MCLVLMSASDIHVYVTKRSSCYDKDATQLHACSGKCRNGIMYQEYRDVINYIKLFVKGTDYLGLKNTMQQKSLLSVAMARIKA